MNQNEVYMSDLQRAMQEAGSNERLVQLARAVVAMSEEQFNEAAKSHFAGLVEQPMPYKDFVIILYSHWPGFKLAKFNLVGSDGNAWSIMGFVNRALKHAGAGSVAKFWMDEVKMQDYYWLLATAQELVEPENEDKEDDE